MFSKLMMRNIGRFVREWSYPLSWLAVGFALIAPLLATAATYVYDANGRLRAVTSSTGASSEYIYDLLGNIYAINSVPAGQVAIFAFTPSHGSVGSTVTLFGQGFSTTPASNIVKFNGAAATVQSPATATQLKVTVPTGATTGTLSVQVGTSTTTSVDIFTVTADAGVAPTLSGFTPAVIASGGIVTVNGSHFVTNTGATLGAIGEMNGAVSSLTDSQLSLTASADAASGYLSVTTPYGSAQSAQPLLVLPLGISTSQVTGVDYLAINGSAQTFNISTANSYGAYVFQGTAGQYLSLQFTTVIPSSGVNYTVYDPTQKLIADSNHSPLSSSNMSIHLPALEKTGTYLVLIPSGAGTAQVTANLVTDSLLVRDGSAINLSTTAGAQSVRILFELTTANHQSLGITNTTISPSSHDYLTTQVLRPESLVVGSPLSYAVWSGGGDAAYGGFSLLMYTPPTNGTYAAIITPSQADTMSFTATLSSPVTATLTLGTAKSISITRAGQVGLYTFTAAAADLMEGYLSNVATTPSGAYLTATLVDQNGVNVPGPHNSISTQSTAASNYDAIPSNGTYQVLVTPQFGSTASAQYTIVKNPLKTVTVDGTAQSVATTVPGEDIYIKFNANSGQNLSLSFFNGSFNPSSAPYAMLYVYAPDGSTITNGAFLTSTNDGGRHFNLLNLTQTGTYSLTVAPDSLETMNFNVAVMQALPGSLSINTAKTVSLTRPGQTALLTFSANAGDLLGGYLNNVATTPASYSLSATVLYANGTSIGGSFWQFDTTTSTYSNFYAIPVTGSYEVLVEPIFVETGSAQLTIATDPVQTAVINGAPVNFATTIAGQDVYLRFAGSTGQNVRLNISNMTTTPPTGINFSLYTSSGSNLLNSGCNIPGCTVPLPTLPSNDTYRLQFYNTSPVTASFSANLLSP